MTTISNVATQGYQNNTPTQAKTNTAATAAATNLYKKTETPTDKDTDSKVNISDRSKQLAKLKADFFSGGSMKNNDIPKLAQRLVDIGLMDAKSLPNFKLSNSASDPGQSKELGKFAQLRAESIKDDGDKKDLFDMLDFVAKVFTDVESASKITDFGSKLNQAIHSIDRFMKEPEFSTLNKDSQESYQDLKLGLSLIKQLPESKIDQGKLDNYLRIASGK
jgi:hypothetical protein